jgi:RNA polymerase sigma factor (sigma-70 family)
LNVPHLVPGPRDLESPVAPPARHDELSVLAEAVVRGERAALRTFLATIVPQLLRVVRRVLGAAHPDLEDVTYEAAYAVLDGLPRFRGEGTVKHFACRVAVLTAMNVRRRAGTSKRKEPGPMAELERVSSEEPDPEQSALDAALTPIVRDLVATLSEPLAEALTLHVILGYTVSEIAQTCGVSGETVRSRLRLAKQALRKRVLGNPKLREALEVEP